MNIVEFALKFKDLASGELGKFGAQAKRTFDNAGKLTNDLTGRNKVLGSSYDVLHQKIKQVESTIRTSTIPSQIREARRELAALQRQSAAHPGNMGGGSSAGGGSSLLGMSGLGKLGVYGAVAAVGYKAGEFLGDAMKKSLERQQILTSFSVLAGSKGAGDALSKDLIKYQKETILGPEVFKNAQTMMGFGFKSTEVMDNLKMLGDVSMGDAEKLGRLTLAFSQTRSAGKLTGQDLLQYIDAGFNPLMQMAEKMGGNIKLNYQKLRKEMENGNISFSMVQQALKEATSEGGKFNNMLAEIAKTPAGKMQALSGAWNEFKINAGSAFMPLISTVLDLASKLLPIIESVLTPLATAIEKSVGFVKEYKEIFLIALGPITAFIIAIKTVSLLTSIWTGAQWLLNIAMDANPIGLIIIAVSALVALVVLVVKKYNDWGAAFTLVMGPLGIMINMFMAFKNNWDSIVNAFKTDGIIGGLKRIGIVLLDVLLYPMQQLLELVAKIPGLGKLAAGGAQRIADVRSRLNLFTPAKPQAGKTKPAGKTNSELMASTSATASGNASATAGNEKSITGGGPKVITITIQKVLDNINIHATTLENGLDEVESRVLETMSRVLGQSVAQAL